MEQLKKKIRNLHGYENLKEILGEELGGALYELVGEDDTCGTMVSENKPEIVCPNLECKAHHNRDACFSCGWDNAILFCNPKVKDLENRFDDSCKLIDRLYASGCLDSERSKLVSDWLAR